MSEDGTDSPRRTGSVRTRLILFALTLCLLMLSIAAVAMTSATTQASFADRLTLTAGPAVDANQRLRVSMSEAQSALRGSMITRRTGVSGEVTDHILQPYLAAESRVQSEVTALDRLFASDAYLDSTVPRAQILVLQGRQREALEAWWAWARTMDAGGETDAADEARGEDLFAAFISANAAVQDTIEIDRGALREATRAGGRLTTQWVGLATLLTLFLALFATWRTVSALTGPIRDLRDTVRAQRAGDRSAWARLDVGAQEVRDLAADVNALTAAHIRLVDDQASALAFKRAQIDIARAAQAESTLARVLDLTADGVGRALVADHAIVIAVSREGTAEEAAEYTREGLSPCLSEQKACSEGIVRVATRLWDADERSLLVSDPAQAGSQAESIAPLVEMFTMPADGGTTGRLLVVPVGLGRRTIGAIVVRHISAPHGWSAAEPAFVQGVSDDLARFVVKSESERDRAEHVRQLEELDQQKDAFLSTVSHELRTPLTSIAGYLEMLKDGDVGELSDSQTKMLDVVDRNAIRLRGLIEDLLVINRIQSGDARQGTELVDVSELVRDTVEELQPTADRSGVTLHSRSESGALVVGDYSHLARAVSNVLANAVKFTPSGGTVDLLAAVDAQTEMVRIVCTDTGMGIPASEQPKLFNRFFRATNAASAQIPGTGLGLAIVKGIVESHGGSLDLTSQEGVGTSVALSLPIAPADLPVD